MILSFIKQGSVFVSKGVSSLFSKLGVDLDWPISLCGDTDISLHIFKLSGFTKPIKSISLTWSLIIILDMGLFRIEYYLELVLHWFRNSILGIVLVFSVFYRVNTEYVLVGSIRSTTNFSNHKNAIFVTQNLHFAICSKKFVGLVRQSLQKHYVSNQFSGCGWLKKYVKIYSKNLETVICWHSVVCKTNLSSLSQE